LWLDRVAHDFRRYPLAVEVRHARWAATEAMDFLRARQLNIAAIDQPQLPGNLPPVPAPTGPVGYVRLHGRNSQAWFASGRTEQKTQAQRQAARNARYDYLYTEAELAEWLPRIRDLAGRTRRTFVFANNHYRGQAAANALQLKAQWLGEKVPVPEQLLATYGFLEGIAKSAGRQGRLF